MAITMKISACLKADKIEDGGVITLHTEDCGLLFLGASVEASVEPWYYGKAPISFVPPPKNTIGLIAVSSIGSATYYPFFVKIGWKDEEPHIFAQDSDKPWIPQADKLAQITNDGKSLSVKIKGEWYTTDDSAKDNNILPISAGNLICRYLVSEGEKSEKLAEEIRQMAVVRVGEESLGKLSIRLSEKLIRQKDELEESSRKFIRQKNELAKLSSENSTRKEKIEKALGFLKNSGFGNRKEAIQLAITALS